MTTPTSHRNDAVSEQPTLALPGSAVDSGTTVPPAQGAAASPAVARVPGYEMLGKRGRGGMGVAYKARQTRRGRIVARKMILAGGHASAAERTRFRTEAEAVARLQHP